MSVSPHNQFSTQKATQNYKKILYWTNAVTIEVPAKAKTTISIDDIKYHLRTGIRRDDWGERITSGIFGIGISPFYETESNRPIKLVGDNDISRAASDTDGYSHNQLCGIEGQKDNPTGGIVLSIAGGDKWVGWDYVSVDEFTKNIKGDGDVSLKNTDRTLTIENNEDKPITKTIYFDSWTMCAHHSTTIGENGQDKRLAVKLCHESFLDFSIKLS